MSLRDFFLKRHGINEVYMQVLTIEDNVLKQILQVFENITHYAKEDIFALTVMIGCFWLVLCKGLLWGPAVIFLIYNGSGLLPFLVVAFIIDLIINKIISTTKSKKNNKKGQDETDAVRFYRYEDLFQSDELEKRVVYFKGIDNSYTLNCLEIYGCVYYSRKRNWEADMRRKLNEKIR